MERDTEERVSRWVAALATFWFALAAGWGLFGPLLAGHYASSASVGIIADNMLRWNIGGPVWEYTTSRPTPDSYYCHHPWGIFWTTAFFMKWLGRHDFVCRLPPVLLSIATPPLLYGVASRIWRPASGAAAAVAFVVLPISLAFANFNALEVPVIAWSLLWVWALLRYVETFRKKHAVTAILGLFFALNADWPAFLLAGSMLLVLIARVVVRRNHLPRHVVRRLAAWSGVAIAVCVATLAMYLYLFHRSHKIDDLLGSAEMRSGGNRAPLARVLAARRYWIELSFTPIAIALGKIGLVVTVVRCFFARRMGEVVPLCFFVMAAIQYVVFAQGADVHIFWPHYFAAYFALVMGGLVASVPWMWAKLSAALPSRLAMVADASRVSLAALGGALLVSACVARDGVPALVYARQTGGRFNEKGLLIHSDGAKTAFLHWLSPKLEQGEPIEMHEGVKATWSQVWALGGRVVRTDRPVPAGRWRGTYLADTRFMLPEAQADLARRFGVTAVGPFWMTRKGAEPRTIEAFSFAEREPSAFQWYFVDGTEPVREIVEDPFLTWELRTHFGQPASIPTEAPKTLEQKRIMHNVAVEQNDVARAAALREEIVRDLTKVEAEYDDGTKVLGTTFHEGARSLLTVYLLAGGPTAADVQWTVRSKVVRKAVLSTTMPDPTDREVGLPLAIPPKRWRKGYIYADPVPIRKRPGSEVFRASFWVRGNGTSPKRLGDDRGAVVVLRLD